jgi:hypothetical protein
VDRPGGFLGQPGEPSGQPRNGFGGFQPQPGLDPRFGAPGADAQLAAAPPAIAGPAKEKKPSSARRRALVGSVALLVVIALAGAAYVTKGFGYFGPSDPGCKAYTSTALAAYNKTIDDLNAQASQTALDADMTTAITDLTTASAQAQSASAKSALSALLAEFKVVRADVTAGSVPVSAVRALNADSAAADHAC